MSTLSFSVLIGKNNTSGLNCACRPRNLTFKLETKSAVSRSVNWLIWSTILVIFSLVGAAGSAVVDSYLLRCEMYDVLAFNRVIWEEVRTEAEAEEERRTALRQHRVAKDIFVGVLSKLGERKKKILPKAEDRQVSEPGKNESFVIWYWLQ